MALWAAGAYAWDRKRKSEGLNGILPALKRASGYGSGGTLNKAINTYGKNVANAAKYHRDATQSPCACRLYQTHHVNQKYLRAYRL